MDWAKEKDIADEAGAQENQLPSLPDESLDRGVLPRVIKSLVERRRNVKKFMKSEKDADKKEEVRSRKAVSPAFNEELTIANLTPPFSP